jgi:hypothetical protein
MSYKRLIPIQFKKMLKIANGRRNWSREFIVGKIPVSKLKKKDMHQSRVAKQHSSENS